MTAIDAVRARLQRDLSLRLIHRDTAGDVQALLDHHAKLQAAPAIDLEGLVGVRNRLHEMACRVGSEWEDVAGELQRDVQALIDGQAECLTCSGHGLIGSASADGGAGHGEACPDCSNEQSTKGDGQAAPRPLIARQLAEWHEDDGPVMWWAWCGSDWAGEPAWCGTPNDSDWPGYHTHWTPHPAMPMQPTKGEGE